MPTHRSRFLNRSFTAALLLACVLCLGACKAIDPGPARQALYVSCRAGEAVMVYEINQDTGELTEVQRVKPPGQVGPIALTDDGTHLYAVIRNQAKEVHIQPMVRDSATGELAMLLPNTPVPAYPTYLDIDATGRFAITASYGGGVVHTFAINDDHLVEGPIQTTNTARTAHACLIDPSNRFVYIPHTVPNAIYQFRFDQRTGKISPIQPIVVAGGGTPQRPQGPRHYAYHPTLDRVYAVNELDSSVAAYAWDRKTGALQRFQSLSTLPGRWEGKNTCADIHITPDGRFLYASNRGHDSIAAYKLDDDGHMTMIDTFATESVPREFAIDLTGRYLYAAGLRSNKLAAYAIDARTGRLNRIGTYDTPEGPIWVEPAALDQ